MQTSTDVSKRTDVIHAAEFSSAPNLTAAAAAQNLDWAPVSVQSVSVVSYSLTQNASSATALLTLTVGAVLGVSGSIADVAAADGSSRRRSLLSTSTGKLTASGLFKTSKLKIRHLAEEEFLLECLQDHTGLRA